MSEAGRSVEVDAARLIRWCDGFAVRHTVPVPQSTILAPDVVVARVGDCLLLTGPDGATARLHPPFPWPDDVVDVEAGARFLLDVDRCAVLLVRRGGYACAVIRGDRVESSKVGTRYVQGRTAAGGWSQQRFANRRDNQTHGLVTTAADVAERILVHGAGGYSWLVTGGDAALVARVLADHRLKVLAELPRGPHLAVGDPRSDVVRALPGLLRAVRIVLIEA